MSPRRTPWRIIALLLIAYAADPRPVLAKPRIRLAVSAAHVGQYARIEFPISVDGKFANPFDPDEVQVDLSVKSPSGRSFTVPAFWLQEYQRRTVNRNGRPAAWMYPRGNPVWRARLAPLEVGAYEAIAEVRDRRGRARSAPVRFTSMPSDSRGFVRVSQRDPRYFEFSNGEPFFVVGQNLAFIGEIQHANLPTAEEILTRLATHGANYVRVWTGCEDWALGLEARKSAWHRSWLPPLPLVPLFEAGGSAPDRQCLELPGGDQKPLAVFPSHSVALEPGTKYILSGRVKTRGDAKVHVQSGRSALEPPVTSAPDTWTPFQLRFTAGPGEMWLEPTSLRVEGTGKAWLDGLSLRETAGGPELLWEADVNRPVRGHYNPIDSFMLDEIVSAAERSGIYLQLCLFVRDLYMSALKDESSAEYEQAIADAKKLLRYAVARWGHSTHVATWEYWNEIDPGLPTNRFYRELGKYLEQIDTYRHLRQTSTWLPSPRDMRHRQLDVADLHFYLQAVDEPRFQNEVEAVLGQASFLRQHAPRKPALITEFGVADQPGHPTRQTSGSDEMIDFHNSLWASALSGTSGTALFWWWDRVDKQDAYPQYRSLAEFLAGIPWTTANLQPSSATVAESALRLVGLQSTQRAYLWLFDPQASWSNVVIRRQTPGRIEGAEITVRGLAPGTYRVQWWDPWAGRSVYEGTASPSGGVLRQPVPAFTRDIACKIEPSPNL